MLDLQPLRAWALTDGVLRARRLVNRWRNRPVAAFNA